MVLSMRDRLEAMADELHFLDGCQGVDVRDEWGYVGAVYQTKQQAQYAAGVLLDMAGWSLIEVTMAPYGGDRWKTKLTFRHDSLLNGMS